MFNMLILALTSIFFSQFSFIFFSLLFELFNLFLKLTIWGRGPEYGFDFAEIYSHLKIVLR